jgi:hypothetical protein
MGAYENPITVVDTESSKMWANAIGNMSNNFIQTIANAKKKRAAADKIQAAQDDWTFDYALKKQDEFLKNAAKAGIKNPSLNKLITDVLGENSKAVKMQKYGDTPELKQQGAARAAELQSMLSSIIPLFKAKNDTFSTFSETFNPTESGDQGSLGFFGKDNQKWQRIASIGTGINPGNEEWTYDPNDLSKGISIKYSGERLGEDNAYGEYTVSAAEAANYEFRTVPYSDKTTSQLMQPVTKENPKGLGIIANNGNLNKQYLDNENATLTITDDGNLQTIEIPPKYQAIAATMNLSLEKEAATILKDFDMANSVWQNTLTDGSEPLTKDTNAVGSVTEEDAIKFTNAWKQRAGTLIPQTTYLDPTTKEGVDFLESPEGKIFMAEQSIVFDEVDKVYKRDINQDGIGDKGLDKGDDKKGTGKIYARNVEGTSKTSVRSKDQATEGEIKRSKTTTRLKTLSKKLDNLNTQRPTLKGTKKQDILFDSELQKQLLPEFSFKKLQGDEKGDYLTLASTSTGKSAEIPSKGLNDARLKMTMWVLDGGTTSDPEYIKLQKQDKTESKVEGLPIQFNPYAYVNE